jgi:alpha-mannosidase
MAATGDDAADGTRAAPRARPLVRYTFGNHMHWVDMTWLWGEAVLPGSVHDMLELCRRAGVQGQVNFDGVGYERLASDDPEAFAALGTAVRSGLVEVVGGSYGQPYGLFHGGESNVRQRVVGARTVARLFRTRLRTFWEEEFDFFPQLPQMLAGVGVSHACLFFQWTWHTPHVPEERVPAVWWTGIDGTRLLTAPRGPLNVHQWPEDLDALLASDLPQALDAPCIVQWLELMPSPDWMCRAELMLPPLQRLLAREDVEVRPTTLRAFLDDVGGDAVERRYTLADVFHGVSLGKNGDALRRLSRRAEARLQAAEAIATITSRFGRPYPRWDVYPAWELAEAWRELLAAQHHDNDECEGLCGHVGRLSYGRSLGLSDDVIATTGRRLAERTSGGAGRRVVVNPLGWGRDALVNADDGSWWRCPAVPPCGYLVVEADDLVPWHDASAIEEDEGGVVLRRGSLRVRVDAATGVVDQIHAPGHDAGILAQPLGDVTLVRSGESERFAQVTVRSGRDGLGAHVLVTRTGRDGHVLTLSVRLAPLLDAVDLVWRSDALPRPDGGIGSALATHYRVGDPAASLVHDHPYAVSSIEPRGRYLRKYPSGDWMTSEQWFEEVERPFTAWSLLDLARVDGSGLLLLHDGSQAFGREPDGSVRQILSLYDPWDEDRFVAALEARVRLVPHVGLRHGERWRLAQEFERPALSFLAEAPGDELPRRHALVTLRPAEGGAAVVALYREDERAGHHHDGYVGRGLGHPLVVRVVEFDGVAGAYDLEIDGTVAAAYRTDLLGERGEPLAVGLAGSVSRLRLELAPHEIATVYLDVVEARKVARDLDARREVWAQVHRRPAAEGDDPSSA